MDSLIYLVRSAIERANIDNKSVENAVCVLRNLSYRAQEIEDPNYDKRQLPVGESRAGAKPTSDNLGCFGASKAKNNQPKSNGTTNGSSRNGGSNTGMDLLWQPEVVQPYLNLLSNCSNPETLEAAAGGNQAWRIGQQANGSISAGFPEHFWGPGSPECNGPMDW